MAYIVIVQLVTYSANHSEHKSSVLYWVKSGCHAHSFIFAENKGILCS